MKALSFLLPVLVAALLSGAAALASSPNVAVYTFSGDSLASSDTDTFSTASDFSLGIGISAYAAPTSFFVNSPAMMLGSDHTPATEADAITDNDYFAFTVTPSGGGALSYGMLAYNFAIRNNSNTIHVNFALRWSVDNFATTVGTGNATGNIGQNTVAGGVFDLSSYGAQAGPVEFRIYVYDDGNSQFSVVGIDSIYLPASYQAPPPRYRLIDLGLLPGGGAAPDASEAFAIDSTGHVAGRAAVPVRAGFADHPTLFSNGAVKDLGLLKSYTVGVAYGLNSDGTIVGECNTDAAGTFLGFIYKAGRLSPILPPAGYDSSSAAAINAAGAVVGRVENSTQLNTTSAFSLTDGSMTLLPPLAGDSVSVARAINATGQVAGYSRLASNMAPIHAIRWQSGVPTDLGTLGGDHSEANGINDAGDVIGFSNLTMGGGTDHVFLYTAGAMNDLGQGVAFAINNSGDIVGDGSNGAFLYTQGHTYKLTDLIGSADMSGFTQLSSARAINDSGWIVGSGVAADGNTHAFLAVTGVYKNAPVIAKGDTAAGITNARFSVFGPPAIDGSGNVAFRATVQGTSAADGITGANNSGIWLYNGLGGTLVARTGDPNHPAPSTNNALFASFSDPVVAGNGVVAFLGKLKVGTGDATKATSVGVWRYQGGTVTKLIRNGDMNGSTTFKAVSEIVVDGRGGLSFLATITDPNIFLARKALGLYGTTDAGAFNLVHGVTTGKLSAFKPLASVSGQTRTVDVATGDIVDVRIPNGGSGQAVVVWDAASFTPTQIAATGDTPAALQGGQIASFGEPILNGAGNVAFTFTQTGTGITPKNNRGIMVSRNGGLDVPAKTAAFAKDRAGQDSAAVYAKLGDPVLNKQNRIAFVGTLTSGVGNVTGATNSAVWSDADGTLKLIAQEGDDAPGYGGGTFSKFDQIVLPDSGGVMLLATVSGVPGSRNQGVWAVGGDGELKSVVREGEALGVNGQSKVVKKIGIFQVAPGVMAQGRSVDPASGKVVYLATFTDGSTAIVTAQP